MSSKQDIITPEYLRERLSFDEQTGILIWKYRLDRRRCWNSRFAGKAVGGAPTHYGYRVVSFVIDGKQYLVYAHRAAFAIVHGRWPDEQIDHRDLNRFMNPLGNLREASSSQNKMNMRRRSDSTSGFKGVSRRRDTGRFTAYINKEGRRIHLGCFDDPQAAARAYDKVAAEIFGDFARLNFPPEGEPSTCERL